MKISTNIPGPLVHYLRRKWRINFFVETGTAYGDTAELAAIIFDQVWSCDIDPTLIEHARNRLSEYTSIVDLAVESSLDFLRRIKPQVSQPVMYWLDAHWCGGPIKPTKECPLIDEIEAIGSLNTHSVLVIDDINLMESPPPLPHNPAHWPTIAQVHESLLKWGEPLHTEVHQGDNSRVLVVTPSDTSGVAK